MTLKFYSIWAVFILLRDMYEAAADAFEKAIKIDPTDTTGYANLAAAYGMLKVYDKEIGALKKVLMFDPEIKNCEPRYLTLILTRSF